MAQPLDPDRWSDFPESRPPQTRASRPDPVKAKGPAGDGARHTSRHRVTVGELVSRAVDAGTSLPAGALASLVCQIAHAALGAEPAADADTPVVDLLTLAVAADGVVSTGDQFTTTNDDVLAVLRAASAGDTMEPSIARLLLARPQPDLLRIARALEDVASTSELASHVARAMSLGEGGPRERGTGAGDVGEVDVVEFDNSSPGTKSPPLPQSPVGRRVVRTTTPPQDHVDHADDEGGRFISLLVRYPARVIGGVAVAAISVVAVLSLLSAGASASASPAEAVAASAAVEATVPPAGPDTASAADQGASPTSSTPKATPAASSPASIGAPAANSGATPSPPTSWTAVLAELDRQRARAFAQGNEALLAAVSAPGSAGARRDAELLAQLNAIHGRAVGLTSEILSSSVIAQRGTTAELDVSDERAAYRIVRADTGALIESRPSRGRCRWKVTLEWINGAWLMSDAEVSEMAR